MYCMMETAFGVEQNWITIYHGIRIRVQEGLPGPQGSAEMCIVHVTGMLVLNRGSVSGIRVL